MSRPRLAGVGLIAGIVVVALVTEAYESTRPVAWLPMVLAFLLGAAGAWGIFRADRRWEIGSRLAGGRTLWAAVVLLVVAGTLVPMSLEQVSTQRVLTLVSLLGGMMLTLPLLYRQSSPDEERASE